MKREDGRKLFRAFLGNSRETAGEQRAMMEQMAAPYMHFDKLSVRIGRHFEDIHPGKQHLHVFICLQCWKYFKK